MLKKFRSRRLGVPVALVVVHGQLLGLASEAWAQDTPDPGEVAQSGSSEVEYSSEQRADLESFLGGSTEIVSGDQSKSDRDEPETAANISSDSSQAADVSVSPQAISVPSGAATLGGMGQSFSAQLTTGVAGFSVPFDLPPGRAGVSPSLALSYSSSGGYGVAGVGWGLGGPMVVARQTDRGIPRYDDRADWHPEQDRFSLGGQELVPICRVESNVCAGVLAGEVMPPWSDGWQYFRSRVEGSFLRVFWSPDHRTWRVQSKDGMNFELGVPLDGTEYQGAIERNPVAQEQIHRWYLVRQYDSHGLPNAVPPAPVNLAQYRYVLDAGVPYLSDVYYTTPASSPGTSSLALYAHHVALAYESRPDPSVTYRPGWLLEQRLRLVRVDVTSAPFEGGSSRSLVRRFHLNYDSTRHASMLASLAMEGRCSSPIFESSGKLPEVTGCEQLPPVEFEYSHVAGGAAAPVDESGLKYERIATTISQVAGSPDVSLGSSSSLSALMDVNGDALPDVLATSPNAFGASHGLYINQGMNGGAVRFEEARTMSISGVTGVDASILKLGNPNVSVLDLDGDARVDLVHMPQVKKYSVFSVASTGSTWQWQGREVTTASGQDVKINWTQNASRTAVMDVDGDGLVDVVFASSTGYQTFFSLGRYPGGDGQFGSARWTGPSSATLSNDPVTACSPWSAASVRLGDGDVRVADANGDGLPDLVRLRSGQVLYWPGRGNGYWGTDRAEYCPSGTQAQNQHVAMTNAPNFGTTQPGSLQLADVNGDGLDDVVEIRKNAVDVYINENGARFASRVVLEDMPVKPDVGNPVRIADINGSGTADIVWGIGHDFRYVDLAGGERPQVLSRVKNGLGKTTELEYQSSTTLMAAAAAAGRPWDEVMPVATPVVVRATVRDNLELIGLPGSRYVTEYSYRDPVFEGRHREFRGFRTAEARQVGDDYGPTQIVRSTHLLGECEVDSGAGDSCAPSERWRDNWREPLKGLPVVQETFDEGGTYLATEHTQYELRQLYLGRDGRRVSMAMPSTRETFKYDTATFVASPMPISLPEVEVTIPGLERTEVRAVTRRASAGTVRIRSTSTHDDFGNAIESTAHGCIQGCSQTDEAITTHNVTERVPGDTSGWLFRPVSGYVTGSVRTAPRRQARSEYDAEGDLQAAYVTLSGTLPLDRFHETGATIAPSPTDQSSGITTPVEIRTAAFQHDIFGSAIETRGPLGACRTVTLDAAYAELPVAETVFGGPPGPNDCGSHAFGMTATYDRGTRTVLSSVDFFGQPSQFSFDGFGRLIARTLADPENLGQLSSLPAETFEYVLPPEGSDVPYTLVISRGQDGVATSMATYLERYRYADGLGRVLAVLAEADPSAGDGGSFVVSGRADYDTKGEAIRTYESYFWSGEPRAGPPPRAGGLRYTTRVLDAFGRPVQGYGPDGQFDSATVYHALSADQWDAADLGTGPHANSYGTVTTDGHGRPIEAVERVRAQGTLQLRRTLTEYLPTGEPVRRVQRTSGRADVVRWVRYDSLGRIVMNVEPNTAVGFTTNAEAEASTVRAWRYAYNDAGELVGTSDSRGCGVNYHYDTMGRLLFEDYSPCLAHHASYTAPNAANGNGTEAFFRYDAADPELATVIDARGTQLTPGAGAYWGRLASSASRGRKVVHRYDGRGRVSGIGVKIARPGAPAAALAGRYAPRWYVRETLFDAADRPLAISTGATSAELLGADDASVVTSNYTARGLLRTQGSSYGTLLAGQSVDANGRLLSMTFGDGAETRRSYRYDERDRVASVQTYRGTSSQWSHLAYPAASLDEPTQQLLLEDYDFQYDAVGNVSEVTDWRISEDWPDSAKPVTRKYEYDDLYRLTRVTYQTAEGTAPWESPFSPENADRPTVEGDARPAPHVSFAHRMLEQRYAYDHLGNITSSRDDAEGFFDRSLGTATHGSASAGPHRLMSASNRSSSTSTERRGDLDVGYDTAGNVTGLVVRRDGACLPAGSSCWQRYHYEWDEIGQVSRARRWDLASLPDERTTSGEIVDPVPVRAPDAELKYVYSGQERVLKTAVDPVGAERHAAYVYSSLELRKTSYSGSGAEADYVLDANTENVLLAGPVGARVVYAEEDAASFTSGSQRVFLFLADYLGSTQFIIDHETGELVEYATYAAYGSTESNYRPERWSSHREPSKFGGKEEDIEVGLAYFGARYLSVGLNVWMSPDPVTIHEFKGDPNPYAYVHGRPTMAVDPDGRFAFLVALVGTIAANFAVMAAPNVIGQLAKNGGNWGQVDWGRAVESWAVGNIAALAGGMGGLAASAALSSNLSAAMSGFWSGAASGAAGGAAAYVAGASFEHYGFTFEGLLVSISIGAGVGAGMGALAGALAPPKPDPWRSKAFESLEAAQSARDDDISRATNAWGTEYSAPTYELDGKYYYAAPKNGAETLESPGALDFQLPEGATLTDHAHTHPFDRGASGWGESSGLSESPSDLSNMGYDFRDMSENGVKVSENYTERVLHLAPVQSDVPGAVCRGVICAQWRVDMVEVANAYNSGNYFNAQGNVAVPESYVHKW